VHNKPKKWNERKMKQRKGRVHVRIKGAKEIKGNFPSGPISFSSYKLLQKENRNWNRNK
jgi:hypothetical protein